MSAEKSAKKKPFISVVMPAYNAGLFIGEVIATILEQTFSDLELIIIDDGSTDNTAEVIKKYATIDPRVKYHYQKNQGAKNLGETINKAVSFAEAGWIARADSDDPWYLDKLERQVAFLESHPDYILIGGTANVTNERGELLYNLYGPLDDDDNRRALTLYTTLAHGSVIFRKDIFEKLNGYQNIHAVEDLDLWQRMSAHGKIYNLPEPLFKYRKNTLGISMSNQDHQSRMVEKLGIEFFKSQTPKPLSRKEFRAKLNDINALRKSSPLPEHVVDWLLIRLTEDNVRISRLFIKYGDKKNGYKQLFSITFSGRLGIKTVLKALVKNVGFKATHLWKKA